MPFGKAAKHLAAKHADNSGETSSYSSNSDTSEAANAAAIKRNPVVRNAIRAG